MPQITSVPGLLGLPTALMPYYLKQKWVLPISKSFPLFPLPAQVPSIETFLTILLTLTSYKALLFLIAFPSFPWPGFHSHAFLVLSLLLLAYPLFCILHITRTF